MDLQEAQAGARNGAAGAAHAVEVAAEVLRRRVCAFSSDPGLLSEGNFAGRAAAWDALESAGLAWLTDPSSEAAAGAGLSALRTEASALRRRWEAADDALFGNLRARLRTAPDAARSLREMLARHVPRSGKGGDPAQAGYDLLDQFCNSLLHPRPMPDESLPLADDMVRYQKTPARVILDLIESARPGPADFFCDVGSGLGQACLLVRLLTGARARGIEFEPAYAAYARDCASDLRLSGVEFPACDARAADYRAPTLLYLYTPFRGRMLKEVLDRMRRQCRADVRVFAYGPCLEEISGQDWLRPAGPVSAGGCGAFVRRDL